MTEDLHDLAVVGVERAQRRLAGAGITDVAVLDDCDLSGSAFDESTHTWTLPTCRAGRITNQIRSGRENLAPYLGVAVHGAPNYFMVTGDDVIADARLTTSRNACSSCSVRAAHASRSCSARSAFADTRSDPGTRQSTGNGCAR